jgi:hypothetical protein
MPHWFRIFNTPSSPRPYTDWIAYDNALLPLFDACLRLTVTEPRMGNYSQADSSGADGEVAYFKSAGRPVFYSKEELYDWARNLNG